MEIDNEVQSADAPLAPPRYAWQQKRPPGPVHYPVQTVFSLYLQPINSFSSYSLPMHT